jgi:hypothetical protein
MGAGIRNYTIFRAGTEMFGYFEADPAAAEKYLAEQAVSTAGRTRRPNSSRSASRTPDHPSSRKCFDSTEHVHASWRVDILESRPSAIARRRPGGKPKAAREETVGAAQERRFELRLPDQY